jgi:thiol-disulfide isomerase/thioredoxin
MRIFTRLLIVLVLLVAAGVFAYRLLAPADESTPAASGVPAMFAATFLDQDGKAQPLSQWRGKVVVVNFWATWCPPCKEEMPELSAFQQKYANRNVVVLGLSTDDVTKIREFAQQAPVQYPLLAGDFQAMALAESLGNNKGVLPYSVVISSDENISRTYFGRLDMKKLEQDIKALLPAG